MGLNFKSRDKIVVVKTNKPGGVFQYGGTTATIPIGSKGKIESMTSSITCIMDNGMRWSFGVEEIELDNKININNSFEF